MIKITLYLLSTLTKVMYYPALSNKKAPCLLTGALSNDLMVWFISVALYFLRDFVIYRPDMLC
jgi:hypothetical protein